MNKIRSYGINIHAVDKDPKQFYNRCVSSLCDGTTSFRFYCGKNNYRFLIEFDDDCDCAPGILHLRGLIDTNTNNKLDVSCDLYCHNQSKEKLNDFLSLIDSKNYDEYISKRFGHLFELIDLLKKTKYDVSCPNELIPKNNCHINSFDFNFVITLTENNSQRECTLIPHNEHLYISRTLKQINVDNMTTGWFYEQTNMDINCFNLNVISTAFKFDYRSALDFDELLKCIECYFEHKNGEYGYLQNGMYFNETHIKEKIDHLNNSRLNQRLQYNSVSNNYYGPDFNVDIIYVPDTKMLALYRLRRISTEPYIYDCYHIRIFYDKNFSDYCVLTIQGKFRNLTDIGNDFYSNREELKHDIHTYTFDIAPVFEMNGTFMECFSKMNEFFDRMTEEN